MKIIGLTVLSYLDIQQQVRAIRNIFTMFLTELGLCHLWGLTSFIKQDMNQNNSYLQMPTVILAHAQRPQRKGWNISRPICLWIHNCKKPNPSATLIALLWSAFISLYLLAERSKTVTVNTIYYYVFQLFSFK